MNPLVLTLKAGGGLCRAAGKWPVNSKTDSLNS